jgi:hypothetical protein
MSVRRGVWVHGHEYKFAQQEISAMIFVLISLVVAHMHMIVPAARFTNARGDQNAPSGMCSAIPYQPDAPSVVLSRFRSQLRGTLRDYFQQCGARFCGNTDPNHVVTLGANTVQLSIGARHVGIVEIWLDDTRLVYSEQLLDSYTVDLQRCSGTCRVRFIMAALHNFPAELYDNCVLVRRSGTVGSVPPPVFGSVPQPSVAPVVTIVNRPTPTNAPPAPIVPPRPVESKPVPKPTIVPPSAKPSSVPRPNPNQPQDLVRQPEWSCSTDRRAVVRTVAGIRYTFTCAPGTACRAVAGQSFPVCNFA